MAKEDLERFRTGFSRELYGITKKQLHSNTKQGLIARRIIRRASVLDDTGRLKKQYLNEFARIQKL